MASSGKVLTVSYGAFSCTLEGFEDAFGTMKAITEYFQELAANDPHFGAVPPTPDPDRLQRIAERELRRSVDASIGNQGVVLRPRSPAAQAQPDMASDDGSGESVAARLARLRALVARHKAPDDQPSRSIFDDDDPEEPEPFDEADGWSVPQPEDALDAPDDEPQPTLEDASELPDGLDETVAFDAPATPRVAEADTEHNLAAQDAPSAPEGPPESAQNDLSERDTADTAEIEGSAESSDDDADLASTEVVGATDEIDTKPADEPAEAKTPRDVAYLDGAAPEASTDQTAAQETAPPPPSTKPEENASDNKAHAGDEDATGAEPVDPPGDKSRRDAQVAEEMDTRTPPVEELPETKEPSSAAAEDVPGSVSSPALDPRARLAHIRARFTPTLPQSEDGATDQDSRMEAVEPEIATKPSVESGAEEQAADVTTGQTETTETARKPSLGKKHLIGSRLAAGQRRVSQGQHRDHGLASLKAAEHQSVRVEDQLRAMFGKAPAVTQEESEPEHQRTTAEIEAEDTTAVVAENSPEELAEVPEAEVEAAPETGTDVAPSVEHAPEVADSDRDDHSDTAIAAEASQEAPHAATDDPEEATFSIEEENEKRRISLGRAVFENGEEGLDEGDVNRLMESANSRLAVADNKRRISAISHLKAAVAATVADRILGTGGEAAPKDPELDRYRDDLSRAVQSRPPAPEAPAVQEGEKPLVLFSEQRIDQADDALIKRVTSKGLRNDGETADSSGNGQISFQDFAQNTGVSDLAELLEAAAAYLAVHEGQQHFSRPQIMRKVALVADEDDFSREDGLRSFGALLRQGRLQKVRRGQFTISDTSRFAEKARSVAN